MKHILRDITPPIVWRGVAKFRRTMRSAAARDHAFEYGAEQPAEYYDRTYARKEHWSKYYTESSYYPIWTVVADRIRRAGVRKILDIGCGPGQIACLLRDASVPEYIGLDFSTARIDRARVVCPEYEFIAANVFENGLLETYHYDCVIMTEFLEHIERDINILKRVRPGTMILATVPDFPAAAHVRHFDSGRDVEERYGVFSHQLDIISIVTNKRGKTFHIMQGMRCPDTTTQTESRDRSHS